MIVFEERRGRHHLTAVREGVVYRGTVDVDGIHNDVMEDEDLKRLKRRMRLLTGQADPRYFGIDAARRRFLALFPEGFTDAAYLRKERGYKTEAAVLLSQVMPLREARKPAMAAAGAMVSVFETGSLHEDEIATMRATLSGQGAIQFVQGASRFADGRYSEGLRMMEMAIRPHGRTTWPMVTYLPWLWMPEDHLFLRPSATRDFASRVGHGFSDEYEPGLLPDVYRSAQDLADRTRSDLEDMAPADMIDVQSFIWVVGRYS